jgi:hypothetical protein
MKRELEKKNKTITKKQVETLMYDTDNAVMKTGLEEGYSKGIGLGDILE